MSNAKPKPTLKRPTPYAVLCPTHGQMFLTKADYTSQMMRADDRWKCPVCFRVSEWDDDNEELYLEGEEGADAE